MDAKVRRVLLQLLRTLERFEPGYARALEHDDQQWLRDNCHPMILAVLRDIQRLAHLTSSASEEDMEALEPTLLVAQRFMAHLSRATGLPHGNGD